MKVKLDAMLVDMILDVQDLFRDSDKTATWFNAKNLNLGGAAPIELINKGKTQKVVEFIYNATKEHE